jgi:hypothetical protein
LLELLDAGGAAPTRALARRLRRRNGDVLAALHELEEQGIVRREQTSASPRSRRWSSDGLGSAWGTPEATGTTPDGFTAASAVVASLGALIVSDRRARWAAAAGIALLALAVALASARRAGVDSKDAA